MASWRNSRQIKLAWAFSYNFTMDLEHQRHSIFRVHSYCCISYASDVTSSKL